MACTFGSIIPTGIGAQLRSNLVHKLPNFVCKNICSRFLEDGGFPSGPHYPAEGVMRAGDSLGW